MSSLNVNVRATAALVLEQVMDKNRSLSSALPEYLIQVPVRDQGLLQAICYGVLRHYSQLQHLYLNLLREPLKGEQKIIQWLILVGLYQMIHLRVPEHAAVSETVSACNDLKQNKLRNLVNASLRNFQRETTERLAQIQNNRKIADEVNFNHPSWLIGLYKKAYDLEWQECLNENNSPPPMWLRINRQYHDRDSYQALLTQQEMEIKRHPIALDALMLDHPVDVNKLPGFEQGWVSIQDASAQLAVDFIDPQAGELILDCCAAPGGKTMHILEHQPNAKVIAIDNNEKRLEQVSQNLQRLNFSDQNTQVQLICSDIIDTKNWWDGNLFDKILLDAPCSATGVIRRHPDIKWLRRFDDIAQLVSLQQQILLAIWPLLKEGGTLVYATCSILPQENKQQIIQFLDAHKNAELITTYPEQLLKNSQAQEVGLQILPGDLSGDGFYYASIKKLPNA